jgi:hypothetical protein
VQIDSGLQAFAALIESDDTRERFGNILLAENVQRRGVSLTITCPVRSSAAAARRAFGFRDAPRPKGRIRTKSGSQVRKTGPEGSLSFAKRSCRREFFGGTVSWAAHQTGASNRPAANARRTATLTAVLRNHIDCTAHSKNLPRSISHSLNHFRFLRRNFSRTHASFRVREGDSMHPASISNNVVGQRLALWRPTRPPRSPKSSRPPISSSWMHNSAQKANKKRIRLSLPSSAQPHHQKAGPGGGMASFVQIVHCRVTNCIKAFYKHKTGPEKPPLRPDFRFLPSPNPPGWQPPTPGPRTLTPLAKGRPWGGDGFVCIKRTSPCNPFISRTLQIKKSPVSPPPRAKCLQTRQPDQAPQPC